MVNFSPRNRIVAICGGLAATIPAVLLLIEDHSPHVVDFLGSILLGFTLVNALVAVWMWVPSEYEKMKLPDPPKRDAALAVQTHILPIWLLRGLISAAGCLVALAVVVFRQQPEHRLILVLAGCILLGAIAYSWSVESVVFKNRA